VSLAKSSTNSNIKITKQSDRVVRTYTTELSKTDSAMKIYLKEVEDYQTAI
jgi:small nuclear ribonucleoprotein (snRNP)-like protein